METPASLLSSAEFSPAEKVVAVIIYSCASAPRGEQPTAGHCFSSNDVDKLAVMANVSAEVVRRTSVKAERLGYWRREQTYANRGRWRLLVIAQSGYQWTDVDDHIAKQVADVRANRSKRRAGHVRSHAAVDTDAMSHAAVDMSHAAVDMSHAAVDMSHAAVDMSHAAVGPITHQPSNPPTQGNEASGFTLSPQTSKPKSSKPKSECTDEDWAVVADGYAGIRERTKQRADWGPRDTPANRRLVAKAIRDHKATLDDWRVVLEHRGQLIASGRDDAKWSGLEYVVRRFGTYLTEATSTDRKTTKTSSPKGWNQPPSLSEAYTQDYGE